ncbi:MAG: hypothetical protein H0X02_04100 [Nitrosomonas sp.]|nr:hypothetical protein [Nitrosomonas sp.]
MPFYAPSKNGRQHKIEVKNLFLFTGYVAKFRAVRPIAESSRARWLGAPATNKDNHLRRNGLGNFLFIMICLATM